MPKSAFQRSKWIEIVKSGTNFRWKWSKLVFVEFFHVYAKSDDQKIMIKARRPLWKREKTWKLMQIIEMSSGKVGNSHVSRGWMSWTVRISTETCYISSHFDRFEYFRAVLTWTWTLYRPLSGHFLLSPKLSVNFAWTLITFNTQLTIKMAKIDLNWAKIENYRTTKDTFPFEKPRNSKNKDGGFNKYVKREK